MGSPLKGVSEQPEEMIPGQASLSGDLIQVERLVVAIVDQGSGAPQPLVCVKGDASHAGAGHRFLCHASSCPGLTFKAPVLTTALRCLFLYHISRSSGQESKHCNQGSWKWAADPPKVLENATHVGVTRH